MPAGEGAGGRDGEEGQGRDGEDREGKERAKREKLMGVGADLGVVTRESVRGLIRGREADLARGEAGSASQDDRDDAEKTPPPPHWREEKAGK